MVTYFFFSSILIFSKNPWGGCRCLVPSLPASMDPQIYIHIRRNVIICSLHWSDCRRAIRRAGLELRRPRSSQEICDGRIFLQFLLWFSPVDTHTRTRILYQDNFIIYYPTLPASLVDACRLCYCSSLSNLIHLFVHIVFRPHSAIIRYANYGI